MMKNNQGGFIKTILIIVLIIVILGYFNVSIRSVLEKDAIKDSFYYVTELTFDLWDKYLDNAALYVWDHLQSFWFAYFHEPICFAWEFLINSLFNLANYIEENLGGDMKVPGADLDIPQDY